MDPNPKISVIVPVYNVSEYLDRCVKSILGQSYSNIEVLLIDDGSPDDCPDKCDEWAKKDSRIAVFHKTNGGLSDARNYGIERAKGEYLAFVDSDDYIDSKMYSVMMNAIVRTNSDVACCGRYYKNKDLLTKSRCLVDEKVFNNEEAIHQLLVNGCIEEAVWDKLYSALLWKNIRFPNGEINEDIVVMPEIIKRSKRIVHVGEPFYFYCYNSSSITKSGYSPKKDVMIKHLSDLEKFVQVNYPEELSNVDLIKARYSLTTLFSIIQSNEENKYKKSYNMFHSVLKKSIPQMLKSNNFSNKQKIEACLIVMKLYKCIWSLIHIGDYKKLKEKKQ